MDRPVIRTVHINQHDPDEGAGDMMEATSGTGSATFEVGDEKVVITRLNRGFGLNPERCEHCRKYAAFSVSAPKRRTINWCGKCQPGDDAE